MIFVVELTPAIDSSGTLQTWCFTDGDGLATRPSDTPANTYIEPRLIDPGLIRRELFAGGELLGPVRSDYGEIVLANVDGALDGWIDYGIAGHGVIIRASDEPTAAYPAGWTTVLVTQMERISVDFSELRITLRDMLSYLDRPACAGSFAGTGGLEGPSSLAGTPKPRLYNEALLIPAVLVDAAKQIYMVHENPVSVPGLLTAWDGGAAYTMDTPYASVSALQAAAPAPGHACAFESGPAYVRLGTNPTYGLYCNSDGRAMNGGSATIGNIRHEVGLSSAPVSGSGFAIAGYAAGDETVLALAANFGRASLSVPSVNRQGEFCAVTLSVPTSGAAVAVFGRGDCIDMRREAPGGIPEPAGVVRVRGGRNYLGDRPLNPSADLVKRPWLAQAWYTSATITHNELLAKYPKATTVDVSIDGMVGAVSGIAAQYEALFCTQRHQYRLTLPLTLEHLVLDLGQVVLLQLPRLGLAAGRPMLIVGIELAPRDRRMQLTVWG